MGYSVVETVKRSRREVSAVPDGWVIGDKVYWPNNQLNTTRKDVNSVPSDDWKATVLHRLWFKNIPTLEMAEASVDDTMDRSGTDDAENILNDGKRQRLEITHAKHLPLTNHYTLYPGATNPPDKLIATPPYTLGAHHSPSVSTTCSFQ